MKKNDRREAILDCVIDILAMRGLAGVTHRAVDDAAGLPRGSSTYYFPKKAALLLAASDHLAAMLEKDCDALQIGFAETVATGGMDDAVAYVARELVSYADASRPLFLARMELTLASARQDDLAGVGERLTAAARRPIAFFFGLLADRRKDFPIETCAGLIDGIGLMHAVGQGPRLTSDQVTAVFRSIL
jgi:DNA-binding transcriptional regulator YbjK